MTTNYTDKDKELIKTGYLQGKSIADLAIEFSNEKSKYDSQKPKIRKILTEGGIEIKRGRRPSKKLISDATHLAKEILLEIENHSKKMNALIKNIKQVIGAISPRSDHKNAPTHHGNA